MIDRLKQTVSAVLCVLVALAAGCKQQPDATAQKAGAAPRIVPVNCVIAKPVKLDNNIITSGTLLASESVDLHSQSSGSIVRLDIKEGAMVEKGALLVKLFDDDLQAQKRKLIAQKETAEKNEQRLKELRAINGVGQQDYENAATQKAGLAADIDNIDAQIIKTEIRAPFAGVIGLRSVSLGAYLSPSVAVAALQKINPLKLDFTVPEKYAAQVKPGDKVTFSVAGYKGEFDATVYAREPHIDENTRTMKVRALVKNEKAQLLPGSFADVTLALTTINDAIMVPTQCVISDLRGKKIVIVKNNKAEFRPVTTGVRTETSVQIVSGIASGDTVVASALLFVKPGTDIKVTKIQ